MGMSFATALAANFQGQELVAKLDAQKQETALQNAQMEQQRAQTAILQRKADGEKQMAAWMQSNLAAEIQPGVTAEDFAKKYTEGARQMAFAGNFDGMTKMQDMAKVEVDRAKQLRVEQEAAKQERTEAAARAAIQYVQAPTPENAVALAGTATNAGVNPVTIPQPGSMEFLGWAKNMQTAALKSKDNLEFVQKQQNFDATLQERQDHHRDQIAMRQATLAQTAAFQNGSLALREMGLRMQQDRMEDRAGEKAERKETAAERANFKETTKLVEMANKDAKPYLQDRQMTQAVKGALSENSAAADKQIQQYLTSLKSGVGKATNLYYKDNKNVGDAAQKIAGLLSQTFTGRFTESQREAIYNLVDGMERRVIDPALRNIELDAKAKAKLYKLDPEPVKLSADFARTIESKTEKGGKAVTGGITEPQGALRPETAAPAPTPAPSAALPTGAPTIRNPKTGETMILQNGAWVKQ